MKQVIESSIKNSRGIIVKTINYGATLTEFIVKNKNNEMIDIIVGLKNPMDYIGDLYKKKSLYLGAIIGPYAGRISGKGFTIDEKFYPLNHNDGVHLHGYDGFDNKFWNIKESQSNYIIYDLIKVDGEEGYPGNVSIEVKYEITEENQLLIEMSATTDKKTILNLTSHPYINLNGKGSVLNHDLQINSNSYLDVDSKLIPTGKILDSTNSMYDRRVLAPIKDLNFSGFDDTFVLNSDTNVILQSEESGVKLTINSNQKGLVVYTPKYFPEIGFKSPLVGVNFPAICFEPQNFPDAPNNSNFPSTILLPNEKYKNSIKFFYELM